MSAFHAEDVEVYALTDEAGPWVRLQLSREDDEPVAVVEMGSYEAKQLAQEIFEWATEAEEYERRGVLWDGNR